MSFRSMEYRDCKQRPRQPCDSSASSGEQKHFHQADHPAEVSGEKECIVQAHPRHILLATKEIVKAMCSQRNRPRTAHLASLSHNEAPCSPRHAPRLTRARPSATRPMSPSAPSPTRKADTSTQPTVSLLPARRRNIAGTRVVRHERLLRRQRTGVRREAGRWSLAESQADRGPSRLTFREPGSAL